MTVVRKERRALYGPGLGWSHDTLNFGVFIMIIYIGEINLQNSYAVSRFVDHLIDILNTTCRKNLLERWKFSILIEYTLPYTTRVWPIEYLNHSKYNVLNIIYLDKETLHTNVFKLLPYI